MGGDTFVQFLFFIFVPDYTEKVNMATFRCRLCKKEEENFFKITSPHALFEMVFKE